MKKATLITTTAVVLAFSAVAEARTSSDAELRGFNACVAQAKDDSNGLVAGRNYLINRSGDSTIYYVNATRWEDGERKAVRVACETTLRGQNLVSSVIEDGHFTNESTRVTVEVAGQ